MKKFLVILIMALLITPCAFAFADESTTNAMLQYNQGIDLFKLGQYDESVAAFRKAIELDPNYIDAYYNLGSVLEYLQQYDAALTVFKQIIVRKPDDYDSVYKAAWLSYKIGDYQKAKLYLKIIPSYSARAQDAQILASQLNAPSTTKSAVSQMAPKANTTEQSKLYENIPTPTGITTDADGNIYIAEFSTNTIIKITTDNKKLVYLKNNSINGPIGIAMDASNNLYIANYNTNNILKVTQYGEISTLINNVKKPYCLYVTGKMLFISCQGSNSVLKYKLH